MSRVIGKNRGVIKWKQGWPELGFQTETVLMQFFKHFSFVHFDSTISMVFMLSPLKSHSSLPKGRSKGCKKRDGSLTFPPFLYPYIPPLHLSLSKAKSLLFPEKETSYKRGDREGKKHHPVFVFFSYKRQLSLTLPPPFTPLHPQSRCHIQIYHKIPHGTSPTILPSPHPPCPPECLSRVCGINELIHTVLSSSIPLLHDPM